MILEVYMKKRSFIWLLGCCEKT